MKASIIVSSIGVLAFDQDNLIVDKELFSKEPAKASEKLIDYENGKMLPEINNLAKRLGKKGFKTFAFENIEASKNAAEELGIKTEAGTTSLTSEFSRENLGEIAVQTGFVTDISELTVWTRDVAMEMSRKKVKKATEKRDLLIVQAVQALDDLDKTLNLFMSRIREWYGLHFPELDRIIDNHETYARLLCNLGTREEFTAEKVESEGMAKNKASHISKIAETSMGGDLADTDMEQIRELCKDSLQLYETRKKIERYIDDMMNEVAPNTRALIGSSLGAKMIGIAGGLSNLAKMPASTVQVLGAEKALFRSITTGARPPKHGIIFQHPLIHEAKRWLRGKIARALAGKLTIAVRTDAFRGIYAGEKLKDDLQRRIEEIEKKYPQPKPRPTEKRYRKTKRRMQKDRSFKRRRR